MKEIRIKVAAQSDNGVADSCVAMINDWASETGESVTGIRTGSFGYRDREPIITVEAPGYPKAFFSEVTEEFCGQFLKNGLQRDNSMDKPVPSFDIEKRIALRNCGLVDPESLNDYRAESGGYSGLAKALKAGRQAVIRELKQSGLRDRNSIGGLTAQRWADIYEAEGNQKILVCSALGSDFHARIMQLLLEGDPHSVLEGLLIAAYAAGASRGVIVIPADFGTVSKKLEKALSQMQENNLLGNDILGSDMNFRIEVREIPEPSAVWEETGLVRFLEGRQAIPYRNSQKILRLNGDPLLIHDAETLSNVSAILQKGEEWFTGIGSEECRGSKVITLTGSVTHGDTVEVPFGTTLDTLVQVAGGGIANRKGMKAVQFGGPTSAYWDSMELSRKLDYETASDAGALMGFDTLEILGNESCGVESAAELMEFMHAKSCGKCVFCREGTLHSAHILRDIACGEGTEKGLELLRKLCFSMQNGTVCCLGQSAAGPILSSLTLFEPEYQFHIKNKKCPHKSEQKGE